MARFCDMVGYAIPTDKGNGIWTDDIVEKSHYGDVIRNTSRWQNRSDSMNDDLVINNQISIVADEFADMNSPFIKYVKFKGVKWKVTSIEVQRPRLILTLGGVYNGK